MSFESSIINQFTKQAMQEFHHYTHCLGKSELKGTHYLILDRHPSLKQNLTETIRRQQFMLEILNRLDRPVMQLLHRSITVITRNSERSAMIKKIHEMLNQDDKRIKLELLKAISKGDTSRTEMLLTCNQWRGSKFVNTENKDHKTLLMLAFKQKNLKLVEVLTRHKPSIRNSQHRCLLHDIATTNDPKIAGLIIKGCTGIGSIPPQNRHGETPVHIAAKLSNNRVLPLFTKLYGGDTDRNINNLMAMEGYQAVYHPPALTAIYKAVDRDNLKGAKLLIKEQKSVVNSTNQIDGETILHNAVAKGNHAFIRYLKKQGANFNQANIDGWTPLYKSKTLETLELVIKLGGDINHQDNRGMSPLHFSAMFGNVNLRFVKKLVQLGADLTLKDKKGRTPLGMLKAMKADTEKEMYYRKDFGNLLGTGVDAVIQYLECV